MEKYKILQELLECDTERADVVNKMAPIDSLDAILRKKKIEKKQAHCEYNKHE